MGSTSGSSPGRIAGRTFVAFGFGPIQAGLFLAEAYASGRFDRLVVAEVLPDVVAAVQASGSFAVNVGHFDHIATVTVQPVEMYQPQDAAGRAALVDAIAQADELATALPSVDFYTRGVPGQTVADLLAAGLRRKAAQGGPLAVVYTAENNTHAAELLHAAIAQRLNPGERATVLARVQFLDTVIGKMSGAPEASGTSGELAPIAPGLPRAFLVEAFNRIFTSRIARPPDPGIDPAWATYTRGITVFAEQADLTPFAEAKLYGHNAGHALAAYLAHQLGYVRIDELAVRPDVLRYVTDAMIEESGVPLCLRYAGVDPLFTPAGFAAFAADLVRRMVNPYVRDTVARVGRDPGRKLAWDDRLVGAMRRALAAGITPRRYALGVAAALAWLDVPPVEAGARLAEVWTPANPPAAARRQVLDAVDDAELRLAAWRAAGFPPLA